ncbi:volume-regulated anion channel subunit LRRC8D [Rhinophrynus dorsalis]
MFTLSEVASLNDIQPTYRILKPWWDVFMDYLAVVMLMVAIFAGTMQITKDQVVCLPVLESAVSSKISTFTSRDNGPQVASKFEESSTEAKERWHITVPPVRSEISGTPTTRPTDYLTSPSKSSDKYLNKEERDPGGRKTNLDYQQYIFINQMCYHVALPWYSKYFPYLALIHTIILMVSSNFWFKYPKTCSKIEHFVSILGKCFESPWTTKALSETACEDSEENKQRITGAQSFRKHLSNSSEEGSPSPSTPMINKSGIKFSADKPVVEVPGMTILDKKDGEQAKALFEKVRKFRTHVEDSDLIYKLYVVQTVIKTVKFMFILCYTLTFVTAISFKHVCNPNVEHLTGYMKFECTHNMAFMLKKLLVSYIALICVYGLVCLYTLFWLFRRPLKEYSFEKVREESSFSDIPDVKNDFAFLLHMVDQYDQLYSKRFGVFLSEVSENKLREISLNHEWTFEKLRQHLSRNAQDKQELHLFMLSGVPDAVFELTDLEVLRLELIPEAKIPAKISQMTALQELHLYHCPAKVEQTAFSFLRDNLKCLHVKFTDVAEIPAWVYLLKNLRELYLMGNLNSENNKMIGLESLRELRHLKILYVKSNLTKIPSNITDVAPHLTKLVIHNDGTKLVVLNSLKKMMNVAELELQNCELERIPHAIFSLTNLQELDLKANSIRTIEEVISFQHLKRLTCLKLWHNKIVNIPQSISQVKNLESLYLSNNKLESLPAALFHLQKLRHLDVSYNCITAIPLEIGLLQNLQHLYVTGNKVDVLPKTLFKCIKLRTLCLGQNCITSIPEKIGHLIQLTHLELKGNCLDHLPYQIIQCRFLKKSGLVVEDHLFDALPSEVKEALNQDTNTPFVNGI